MPEDTLVNTDVPSSDWPMLGQSMRRVLEIQAKLHQWAIEDKGRRFDDLFNLVHDPAFLALAWDRVRFNRGARSPGVDQMTVHDIETRVHGGEVAFLRDVRDALRSGTFRPLPVRERMIPKTGTAKKRRLGIPTVTDRVVQAALKLVLEPIFEADFAPYSYGFRPNRRAHDAIAEIFHFGTSGYRWVLDADIEACFDSIEHAALMARVRRRVGDKRVLALVKAFLKAGIFSELGLRESSDTGTPQGGILSPLLANVALSALDEHFDWPDRVARAKRRRHGLANYRLVRYADDFVVLVDGEQEHVEEIRDQVSGVLATMGLRFSAEKTSIVHMREGFDFLGFHIQWRRKRGSWKWYVYTFASKKSIDRVRDKIRALSRRTAQPSPEELVRKINQLMGGWCNYFKHGVVKHVFAMLNSFSWKRVARWLRKWHKRAPWKWLRRKYFHHPKRWDITASGVTLFRPSRIPIVRYRYRGMNIPTPWTPTRKLGSLAA